jgi:hypothetical protein
MLLPAGELLDRTASGISGQYFGRHLPLLNLIVEILLNVEQVDK